MARRYCGSIAIDVVYADYEVYRVRVLGRSFNVGAPASGFGAGIGYDSSEAYDQVARAAVSFSEDESESEGEWGDAGPVIRRTK